MEGSGVRKSDFWGSRGGDGGGVVMEEDEEDACWVRWL